jgi:hypothetical protein
MRDEVSCMAIAYLRANKKQGPQGDCLTASCAALAAITLAQINDANIFAKNVRKVEGLPDQAAFGLSGLPSVARSGKTRAPSDVPGMVTASGGRSAAAQRAAASATRPAGRPAAPAGGFGLDRDALAPVSRAPADRRLPTMDVLPPPEADLDFETEPDFDDPTAFTDSFGRPDVPADRNGSPPAARTRLRPCGMSTTASPSTAATPSRWPRSCRTMTPASILEALNFDADEDAEPGIEVVDTAIQRAVLFDDDEAAPPPPKSDPVADHSEIDRADVASAKATQWTGRAQKPAAAPAAAKRAAAPDTRSLFSDAQAATVTMMGGGASEMSLLGDSPPRFMGSNLPNANGLASMVCRTTLSVAAFIEHCFQEAFSIIEENKSVVVAVAQALIDHPNRTLNSNEIDAVIVSALAAKAAADKIERRARWAAVENNAAQFCARSES